MHNISIPGISDNKWKELIEQQEYDLIIFEIREQLITHVLDECYKKYIQKESIKYIVDCAYLAWKEIVDLNYFVHDRVTDFYGKESLWIPDEEIDPCDPDSWAKGNISMKPHSLPKISVKKIETVLSDYQIIECTDYPSEHKFNIQHEVSKSDNLITIHDSDSYSKQEGESGRSKFSVQFTSFVSYNDMSEEKILEHIKEEITNDTAKNDMKSVRKKNVCVPEIVSSVKIIKKKPQLTWYEMDQQVESPQPLNMPLPRLIMLERNHIYVTHIRYKSTEDNLNPWPWPKLLNHEIQGLQNDFKLCIYLVKTVSLFCCIPT